MATTPSINAIFRNGLWQENPGIVQLLGLCPLLAVSNTLVNSLGLGVATIFVMCMTNLLVSMTRRLTHHDLRLPVFVLVIATFVTLVELLFKAWLFDLHLALGIFLPLIVTNCMILGRAEAFASRQPLLPAVVDGFAHGLGFAWVLVLLGGARELIGSGTLLRNAEFLFGPAAEGWQVHFGAAPSGLLLAILPPGAFIGLGLLVAARNRLQAGRNAAQRDAGTTGADPTAAP
ncbi:MAG: electron transport complex subunit E [Gammaproteobacteria bacterium]|nr:electron transport complex subunit E [Gammaproteobacteria bacterium]NND37073.1 electron transport complex subunit E [Gammaproteobacteria bacterium]